MARRPSSPDHPQPTGLRHLRDLAQQTIPPLHPAGLPFVAGGAAVALVARRRPWVARPAWALTAACAAFFRHPGRVPPTRPGVVVAAADGEVALVDTAVPPPELGLGSDPLPRVSTFLSVFDVHVQRAPVAGKLTRSIYVPGAFLNAAMDKASEDNERRAIVIELPDGEEIACVQIAGLVARRIITFAGEGDILGVGQRYGLIRFGSRVDVYLPPGKTALVSVGQRAVAGETVFADLTSAEAPREARRS